MANDFYAKLQEMVDLIRARDPTLDLPARINTPLLLRIVNEEQVESTLREAIRNVVLKRVVTVDGTQLKVPLLDSQITQSREQLEQVLAAIQMEASSILRTGEN